MLYDLLFGGIFGVGAMLLYATYKRRTTVLAILPDPKNRNVATVRIVKKSALSKLGALAVQPIQRFGPFPITPTGMALSLNFNPEYLERHGNLEELERLADQSESEFGDDGALGVSFNDLRCVIGADFNLKPGMQLDVSVSGMQLGAQSGILEQNVRNMIFGTMAQELVLNGWMRNPVLPGLTCVLEGPREAPAPDALQGILQEAANAFQIRGFEVLSLFMRIESAAFKAINGKEFVEAQFPPLQTT